jgi:hypothetical protein
MTATKAPCIFDFLTLASKGEEGDLERCVAAHEPGCFSVGIRACLWPRQDVGTRPP